MFRQQNTYSTNHIVFITGPPEYGKTYTAIRILWEYYENGFDPICFQKRLLAAVGVRDMLFKIESLLRKKRIFYFEDPFGDTKYEPDTLILILLILIGDTQISKFLTGAEICRILD